MATFTSTITKSLLVNELRVRNDLESYRIEDKMLGQGGFGRVFLAQRQSDNKKVALKFFGYARAAPDIVFINNEIMLMTALLGVPGVIQLESIIYDVRVSPAVCLGLGLGLCLCLYCESVKV